MPLYVEPFLKCCLVKTFGSEKWSRNHVGQLNFRNTLISQIRCNDIDTTTEGIYDFRNGVVDGEGIGYTEEASCRIAAGALKRMGADQYFESLVYQMFGYPYPAEVTGGEVVSGWPSGRCGRKCRSFAVFLGHGCIDEGCPGSRWINRIGAWAREIVGCFEISAGNQRFVFFNFFGQIDIVHNTLLYEKYCSHEFKSIKSAKIIGETTRGGSIQENRTFECFIGIYHRECLLNNQTVLGNEKNILLDGN